MLSYKQTLVRTATANTLGALVKNFMRVSVNVVWQFGLFLYNNSVHQFGLLICDGCKSAFSYKRRSTIIMHILIRNTKLFRSISCQFRVNLSGISTSFSKKLIHHE